jgi:putative ABC transport system substrate-binding protein
MRRREFIIGSVAASAWPLAVEAQQPAVPVIGFIRSEVPEGFEQRLAGFHAGLKQAGYVEGQNVAIEFRWGRGQGDALAGFAADLVRRRVTVIVTSGSPTTALAAQSATSTIPIVFVIGGDPVKQGLVTSLNRPSGNITGVTFINNALAAKRLELLGELVPTAKTIAVLVNPASLNAEADLKETQAAALALGLRLKLFNASTVSEIDTAFAKLAAERASALFVSAEPFFTSRREQIVALAARNGLPASYSNRENVEVGGLMSYGASIVDAHRQLGFYTGRILKGERTTDLPVMQPVKFDLSINLKTAKALGLTVPPKLLFTADEVIE